MRTAVTPSGCGPVIPARQIVWIIALLGLLFRVEYLAQYAAMPNFAFAVGADVADYYERAQAILQGRTFPEIPDIHAPLYGFFLAAVCRLPGNGVVNARIIQLLLNYGALFAMYALLLRKKTPLKIALAFLALATFTPILCFHQAELVSESLLLPLTAGALWSFELAAECRDPRRYFLPGLFCALAVLTHGFMLSFAAAEALLLLWRKKFAEMSFFCLALAVVLLSVVGIKSSHYGEAVGIQANGAFNVWLGNNPQATGGCYLRPGVEWRKEHRLAREEAEQRGISVNALYWRRIGDFWLHHPGKAFLLTLKKGAAILSPYELIAGADPASLIYATKLQNRLRGFTGIVFLFALLGILFAVREKITCYDHFYLLAGALFLAQLFTVTASRYRVGMMPAVLLLAAIGAAYFPWKRGWYLIAAAAVMFHFLAPRDVNWEEKTGIYGEALFYQGRDEEAEAMFRMARVNLDDPARIENFLGRLAEKRGDFAAAEKHYRLAISGEPEDPNGYLNLGMLCFNAPGRRQEAIRLLIATLARNPVQPAVCNHLGIAAMEQGKFQLAEQYFNLAVTLNPGHPGYQRNLQISREAAKEQRKK